MALLKPIKWGQAKAKRFKASDENEIVKLIGDIHFSDKMFEQLTEGGKIFKKELFKFRAKIQDLVLLRNNILNHLKLLQDFCDDEECSSS